MAVCTVCNKRQGFTAIGGLCPECHEAKTRPAAVGTQKDQTERKSLDRSHDWRARHSIYAVLLMAFLNRLFQHQLCDQPQLASYAMMYFSILVIVLVLGLVLGVMAL